MSGAGRGKGANGNRRKKISPSANSGVVEELDEVRRQMRANYAKRSQVPKSVLLSHAAQLPPPSSRSGSHGDDEHAGDSGEHGGVRVRWLRDFAAVLENVYALPLDASVSSTSTECRRFMDEGVWLVPTTGSYLVSAIISRRTDLMEGFDHSDEPDSPTVSAEPDEQPRVVLRFVDGADSDAAAAVEWQFPVQPGLEAEGDVTSSSSAGGQEHRAWMARAVADQRNRDTSAMAIDVQHRRRAADLRGRVEAEEARRKRHGRQHFHFPRVTDLMNAKLKNNKERLEVVEAEERERLQRLEAERQASPSVAEFFGRLFRLRQGASMRIGLIDPDGNAFRYRVTVTVAMMGELTNYTVGANGREMPFASCQMAKPFGCFQTGKRFNSGQQLVHHMWAKGLHRPPVSDVSTETASPAHQCPQCSKSFGSEQALKAHSDTKLHVKCEECGGRFRNEEMMRQHCKDKHLRDQRFKEEGINLKPWCSNKHYAKAMPFYWPRPKFCCEMEGCGRAFMSTEQLSHHHRSVKHYKCKECPKVFEKRTHMFRHYKAKHDPAVYQQGLVDRLQAKLTRVRSSMAREKFGTMRWAEKKEKLEIKLARAMGLSLDEFRNQLAIQPVVTEGAKMEKSPTSQSVINIVPPRDQWEFMQRIRTLHVSEARCGPHISFVEPFVMPQHYDEAVKLLTPVLRHIDPFEVVLSEVSYLRHDKSTTIILAPDYSSESKIVNLVSSILRIFPQCSDLLSRGSGRSSGQQLQFVPHFTLRKFRQENYSVMYEVVDHYNEQLSEKPIKFMIKEIYILSRIKGDPFQVAHIIPLGDPKVHTQPYFGPGSPGTFGTPEESTPLGRSLLIGGIPQRLEESVVQSAFEVLGFVPKDVEVVKNPDGARRSCAVVEMATVDDARRALETFDEVVEANLAELTELGLQPRSLYLRHMPEMVFPGPPGDCCSHRHVKREDVDPPADWMRGPAQDD